MSNVRFALLAVALFGLAFAGIFGASKFGWGSKASPATTVSVAPAPKPEARVSTTEESSQKGARKEAEGSKVSPGDTDAGRNQLRLTALQAANAYALSPCDKAIKAAFVVATSTYIKAMTGKMGCFGFICTGGDKAAAGAETFSTPMDARVREAIQAAFEAGGVTKDDFPSGAQLWVAAIAASHGDAASPCGAGRQAQSRRP